jgi:hypothetical protein
LSEEAGSKDSPLGEASYSRMGEYIKKRQQIDIKIFSFKQIREQTDGFIWKKEKR